MDKHYVLLVKSTGRYVGETTDRLVRSGHRYLFTGRNRGRYVLIPMRRAL